MTANDVFSFNVADQEAGQRFDALLAARLIDCSRSYAALLIRRGHVQVDGMVRKPSYHVKTDEVVSGRLPRAEPIDLIAEPIPLDVLFEDRHLIVVNKAPGLVVHPAAGHACGTLVNALLHHCPDLEGIGGERRPGIVHRLDKDTSGALVVAKTARAHHELSRQFKSRSVQKQYLALVYGEPPTEGGEINLPVGRHPIERKKMATTGSGGRPALTLWQVRRRFAGAALLKLDLKTGRTHQIRVHCQAMGHPIVGDRVYGQRRTLSRLAKSSPALYHAAKQAPRQMLHALQLGFSHPLTAEPICFKASLPEDMKLVIKALQTM